ncbi:MAG: hypothetical protein ACK4FJ_06380 [Ferrovibrio sp.]|uniref:hypothetical protein n=1 Tax=Ferrovibrio sp. TaxID=1917215 RepID=UPI00391AC3A2
MSRAGLIAALLPVLLLVLAGCAGDPYAGYRTLPDAIQRPHPQTVPHTDRTGAPMAAYDPLRSFLPLALGGALADYAAGPSRGFQAAFAADFNAVSADPGQPLPALLNAANGSRVQLLVPRVEAPDAALLDSSRAVVVEMPRDPLKADRFAATARDHATQPVWALLPAYARGDERLIDPAQARALAFAALVHGASGLIWQGEDNYAARNAGALGISNAPRLDYGITMNEAMNGAVSSPPRRATAIEVAASKRLWDAVAQLNRRIGRLRGALLQPDAGAAYNIAVRDAPMDDQPVLRAVLKPWDDDWLLIVVNLRAEAQDVRIGFPGGFRQARQLDGDALPQQDAARGLLRDEIEGHGLRLYKISR